MTLAYKEVNMFFMKTLGTLLSSSLQHVRNPYTKYVCESENESENPIGYTFQPDYFVRKLFVMSAWINGWIHLICIIRLFSSISLFVINIEAVAFDTRCGNLLQCRIQFGHQYCYFSIEGLFREKPSDVVHKGAACLY